MKSSNLIGAGVAIVVVMVMLMAGATTAYALDACKNVKFKVTNERSVRIRITKVEYHNADNDKKQSENINPKLECIAQCNAVATCTTKGDNLRDSEGVNLTKFVLTFNDEASFGKWSSIDRKSAEQSPEDNKCSANKTYNLTIK